MTVRRVKVGFVCLLLAATAAASRGKSELPAPGDSWIQVDTVNFTLYSNAPEGVTVDFGVGLEQLRAVLAQLFEGLELSAPVPTAIYVFKSDAAFAPYKLRYAGRAADVAGYFMGHTQGNYVAIDGESRRDRDGDPAEIIYHEYLHYVLNNNHPELPVWYNEGLAEFYSSFDVSRGDAKIGLPIERHIRWLRDNRLIPLRELFRLDHDSEDYNEGDRRGVFYAQSWALTHYLLVGNPDRRQQTGKYADLRRDGVAQDEAFRVAYGVDYDELERELKGYLRGYTLQSLRIPVAVEVEKSARVTPMRRADVLYRLGDLLAMAVPERSDLAAEHFQAAIAEDPKHAQAYAGLGYLAETAGRDHEARGQYARAAALAPTDARINYLYGKILAQSLPIVGGRSEAVRERIDLARAALNRSVASRPQFAEAWAALGFTYVFDDDPPPAAIRALETAARMLPTRTDVVFNLLIMRARLGERDTVVSLIARLQRLGAEPNRVERGREALLDLDMRRAHDLSEADQFQEALELLAEVRARTDDPSRLNWVASQVQVVRHNRTVRRYNRAVTLGEQGEYAAAIVELEEVLNDEPDENLERSVGELLGRMKRRLRSQHQRGR